MSTTTLCHPVPAQQTHDGIAGEPSRKCIVCSWNIRSSIDAFQDPWEADPLKKPIELLLRAYNWKLIEPTKETEKEVRLIVLIPRVKDHPVSVDDASVFRHSIPGNKKRVLLVERPGIPFRFENDHLLPEWLWVLRIEESASYEAEEFKKWLEGAAAEVKEVEHPLNQKHQVLIEEMIGKSNELDACHQILSKSGTKLLVSTSYTESLCGVFRMSSRYDRLEHDLNRAGANLSKDDKELAEARRMKMLLDIYFDLRSALAVRQRLGKAVGTGKILLIDDNPGVFHGVLEKLIRLFVHEEHELCVWNPTESAASSDYPTLSALESYSSLGGGKLASSIISTKLPKMIQESCCILVDLLLDDGSGEKDCGHTVIRGLTRLVRDLPSPPDLSPPIIALSRSDDLKKIQVALNSGADGYVSKSRLLSLPKVLADLRCSATKQFDPLHRNFRSLDKLPRETIRLLRSVSIHKYSEGKSKRDEARHRAVENLLKAIPKTDLHVHLGSCMKPEFLVLASVVMLSRHFIHEEENKEPNFLRIAGDLDKILQGKAPVLLPFLDEKIVYHYAPEGMRILRKELESAICLELEKVKDTTADQQQKYRELRSVLHRFLSIPDHLLPDGAKARLATLLDVDVFFFALHQHFKRQVGEVEKDDIKRLFILLMARKEGLVVEKETGQELGWDESEYADWEEIAKKFWQASPINVLRRSDPGITVNRRLVGPCLSAVDCPVPEKCFFEHPLTYSIATGPRSSSLREYLEGCELTGAEHLKHQWLMALYAQHVLVDFIRYGVVYVELRASPDGYEDERLGFSFQQACISLREAFEQAQKYILCLYNGTATKNLDPWMAGLLGHEWSSEKASELLHGGRSGPDGVRYPGFPVKVGLIFVGKRHKAAFELVREAAAVVMHGTEGRSKPTSASDFSSGEFEKCRVVGFDLAGQEPDHPPALFGDEYGRLSKMHIPVTVHAGENAPSQFIADAVWELDAQRIGHGLTVVDNPRLMDSLREKRICIELCPVSNHQTCHFYDGGRQYPLRKLLENGNPVCINTDNPVISATNMVKECIKASEVCGEDGLSFWELLRIVRMGFVHSFMTMPERRALLQVVDQILLDLFSRNDVETKLAFLCASESAQLLSRPVSPV